jgi:hypothetical protein
VVGKVSNVRGQRIGDDYAVRRFAMELLDRGLGAVYRVGVHFHGIERGEHSSTIWRRLG